jgi:hypothetical protein
MIRDRQTGQVFYDDEWRRWILSNGGPSFDQLTPEILELLNADPVFEGPQPTLSRYQTAAMQGVIQAEGKWYTNWVAIDLSTEARAILDQTHAQAVRQNRDLLLTNTDWVVLKALENDAAIDPTWKHYRQSLRDLPGQPGFPWDITWPAKPEQG